MGKTLTGWDVEKTVKIVQIKFQAPDMDGRVVFSNFASNFFPSKPCLMNDVEKSHPHLKGVDINASSPILFVCDLDA